MDSSRLPPGFSPTLGDAITLKAGKDAPVLFDAGRDPPPPEPVVVLGPGKIQTEEKAADFWAGAN